MGPAILEWLLKIINGIHGVGVTEMQKRMPNIGKSDWR